MQNMAQSLPVIFLLIAAAIQFVIIRRIIRTQRRRWHHEGHRLRPGEILALRRLRAGGGSGGGCAGGVAGHDARFGDAGYVC